MIVYGDPQFSQSARPQLLKLRSTLDRTNPHSLDQLRTLLVQAGQFEQALEDSSDGSPATETLNQARLATDLAASAFCDVWFKCAFQRTGIGHPPATPLPLAEELLAKLAHVLHAIDIPPDLNLTVKTPEGFAFYTLFPEQYCAAALKWAESHPDSGAVLIVGVRSIGTTLSAVTRATLLSTARVAERLTVRPNGHPFNRKVAPPGFKDGAYQHAIIVDEGPGLSGSSMAATARALAEQKITSISFFPGHDGLPGNSASPEVLDLWQRTRSYVTKSEDLRWNRLSLLESLARETSRIAAGAERTREATPEQHAAWDFIYTHAVQTLFGVAENNPVPDGFDLIQDCSGGLWRQYAFHAESAWPFVASPFERMKFRCSNHQGAAVLWKFAGFGEWRDSRDTETAFKRVQRLAEAGFTPPCLGTFRGFMAFPWVEGIRLTIADGIDTSVLQRIGHYIAASAEPPLTAAELHRSLARATDVLYWNTHEVLGSAFADQARNRAKRISFSQSPPTAGDGHLAPHEWILSPASAQVLKLDCEGHSNDHTVVGRQPIHWDIAGALVEWDLDINSAAPLLTALERNGIALDPEVLGFYILAYSAFRMGLMSLCLAQNTDLNERRRLQLGYYFYQNRLSHGLKSESLSNPLWRSGA